MVSKNKLLKPSSIDYKLDDSLVLQSELLKFNSTDKKLDNSSLISQKLEVITNDLKRKILKRFSSKSSPSILSFINTFESLAEQHMKSAKVKIGNEGFLTEILRKLLNEGVVKCEILMFALEYHYTSFKKLKEAVSVTLPEPKLSSRIKSIETDTELSLRLMWLLATKFIDQMKTVKHPKNIQKIRNIINHQIDNFMSNKIYSDDYKQLIKSDDKFIDRLLDFLQKFGVFEIQPNSTSIKFDKCLIESFDSSTPYDTSIIRHTIMQKSDGDN